MSCIWLILDKESNIADHEVYFPIDSQVKNWSKTNSKEKFFIRVGTICCRSSHSTRSTAAVGKYWWTRSIRYQTHQNSSGKLYPLYSAPILTAITFQTAVWKLEFHREIENLWCPTLGTEKRFERSQVQVWCLKHKIWETKGHSPHTPGHKL